MRTITNQMIRDFEVHLCEEERSDNTIQGYLRHLRFFADWLDGRELSKSAVLAYKKELCGRYAPASVNSMLSSLNSLLAFMGLHECRVKALKIQKQIFSDSRRELTRAEYMRLLHAAQKQGNEQLCLLMQTIGSTGIRISELQYITVESVHKEQAVIQNKGKLRKVFLPKELCRMLKGYIRKRGIRHGSIFVTKTGMPLNRSNVWRALKNLCEKAKVSKEKVFPHNLRHLFARTYYSQKKDVVRLADILGHSSINTTRIYTMETGLIHRQQIQKLGLLLC